MPLFATVLLMVCVVLARLYFVRVQHAALGRAERAIFDRFVGTVEPSPTYRMGYAYGVPVFRIVFASEEGYSQAQRGGLAESFVAAIQELCGNRGSRNRPYDAGRAVEFAWLRGG